MRIQSRSLALSALLFSTTLALPAFAASAPVSPEVPAALGTGFSQSALATGLEMPWEITLGQDKFLWLTEHVGKRVSSIDVETDKKSAALAIDEVFVGKQNEDLISFALHPELGMGKDHDFVYVAYIYDSGQSGAVGDRRSKIVQYYWDAEAGTLTDPVDLLSGAISEDGSTIYVATEVEGGVRDPLTSGVTEKLTNPGSILVFRYANPVTN